MGVCGHVRLNWPDGHVPVGFVLACSDCRMRWMLTDGRGWQLLRRDTEVPTGLSRSRGRPPDPSWDLSADAF